VISDPPLARLAVGFLFLADSDPGNCEERLGGMMTTLLVETEDKQDVLVRVVMLFHSRAIPILSFSMTPAEQPGIIRMAIAIESDQVHAERITAHLYKLVNVLTVKIRGRTVSPHQSRNG
jgi:acetolactate synthase small subunit